MTNAPLPAPLSPADCDLRDFAFMPLDVVRLRDSDIAAVSTGDEFRCAVLLWCAAWHQVPAGSLPDDDIVLSQYAGFGRVVKEWQKVRDGALRGWVKCADGRLYHPVVCEKVNEAWAGRLKHREKKEAERVRKALERAARKAQEEADEAAQQAFQDAQSPPDIRDLSGGQTTPVQTTDHGNPAENALRGTVDSGEGQWTVDSGQLTSKPISSGSIMDSGSQGEVLPSPTDDPEHDHPTQAPLPARQQPPLPDEPAIQMSVHLRHQGVQVQFTHPAVQDWVKGEVPLEVLDAAVRTARERLGERAKINGNYLVPIVHEILNPPPKIEAAPQKPKSDDWAWKRSNQGIDAKGRELGMFARGGESYPDFAARIQAAIDKRKGSTP